MNRYLVSEIIDRHCNQNKILPVVFIGKLDERSYAKCMIFFGISDLKDYIRNLIKDETTIYAKIFNISFNLELNNCSDLVHFKEMYLRKLQNLRFFPNSKNFITHHYLNCYQPLGENITKIVYKNVLTQADNSKKYIVIFSSRKREDHMIYTNFDKVEYLLLDKCSWLECATKISTYIQKRLKHYIKKKIPNFFVDILQKNEICIADYLSNKVNLYIYFFDKIMVQIFSLDDIEVYKKN
jgi:hypothetical protein